MANLYHHGDGEIIDLSMLAHLLHSVSSDEELSAQVIRGVLDRVRGQQPEVEYDKDAPMSCAYWMGYDFH